MEDKKIDSLSEEVIKVLDSLNKAVVNDIKVYDMKNRTPFYDYAIICSANTSRQGLACANYLKDDAEKIGLTLRSATTEESSWYLVDLNDVVVHIFVGEAREFYNLDEMYSN